MVAALTGFRFETDLPIESAGVPTNRAAPDMQGRRNASFDHEAPEGSLVDAEELCDLLRGQEELRRALAAPESRRQLLSEDDTDLGFAKNRRRIASR